MTADVTPAEALDKLNAEGSPAQVAARLLADQCHGSHSSLSCPVSNWVLAETGCRVYVSRRSWGQPYGGGGMVPEHVAEFVRDFDGYGGVSGYPELEVQS